MNTKILYIVPVILVIVILIYYFSDAFKKTTPVLNGNASIKATFNCTEGKTIKAEFANEKVKLLLSDGRNIEIPQAISASGARYANKDESFVFWNKGNTAFIEEKGTTTFTDCVEAMGK